MWARADERLTRRLRELQEQRWIDLQTRELRLLFTYYNPTVDLFCAVALHLDFLDSGGVETSSTFRTIDPQRHVAVLTDSSVVRYFPPGVFDYVMLVIEAIFWFFVLYRLIGEFRWVCRAGIGAWLGAISVR